MDQSLNHTPSRLDFQALSSQLDDVSLARMARVAAQTESQHRNAIDGASPRQTAADEAALPHIAGLADRWAQGAGQLDGDRYRLLNPRRTDNTRLGNFDINLLTGVWGDFAKEAGSEHRGKGAVSYVAYCEAIEIDDATALLGYQLRMTDVRPAILNTIRAPERFEPLDVEVIKAGPAQHKARIDKDSVTRGKALLPAPADVPLCPLPRLADGETHRGRWIWADAEGRLLAVKDRIDGCAVEGKRTKRYMQSTWRAHADGRPDRWGRYGPDAGFQMPFYNAQALKEKPGAGVVLAEGEKSADAAQALFGEAWIGTTAWGGAASIKAADFSALAGRTVIVAPDNDDVGREWTEHVAKALVAVGCNVRLLDIAALYAASPASESRAHSEAGWDLADAAAEWQEDLDGLRATIDALAPATEAGPPAQLFAPHPFILKNNIVCAKITRKDVEVDVPLCNRPFEVLGRVRDNKSGSWGTYIRWLDNKGVSHVAIMADGLFQYDPRKTLEALANQGLSFGMAKDVRPWISIYFAACGHVDADLETLEIADRIGWHETYNKDLVFVTSDRSYDETGRTRVIAKPDLPQSFGQEKSLEAWQDVALIAADHPPAVFVLSVAVTGPLIKLARKANCAGGFHLFGASSRGKSTLLNAAASVWGNPSETIMSWQTTEAGLLANCAATSDVFMAIDETNEGKPEVIDAGVYLISNGKPRTRANRDGSLMQQARFRSMALSTGEHAIRTTLGKLLGGSQTAGQEIRLLDVPADYGDGHPFNCAGRPEEIARIADDLRAAASSAYGTAGPAFLKAITEWGWEPVREVIERSLLKWKRETPARWRDKFPGQEPCSAVVRAVDRFALVAVAGELAIKAGVFPFPRGAASEAAKWAMDKWIEERGSLEALEEDRAFEGVSGFIQMYGASAFKPVARAKGAEAFTLAPGKTDWRDPPKLLGYRLDDEGVTYWLVFKEVWRGDVCKGQNQRAVAKTLAARGILKTTGGRGYSCRRVVDGYTVEGYLLTSEIIGQRANVVDLQKAGKNAKTEA